MDKARQRRMVDKCDENFTKRTKTNKIKRTTMKNVNIGLKEEYGERKLFSGYKERKR